MAITLTRQISDSEKQKVLDLLPVASETKKTNGMNI